ncbi:MAG: radical SAM protein [Oscillospiraceae bacterium]|nr:radical SAM protein [Oscillospiraceae bacterium]
MKKDVSLITNKCSICPRKCAADRNLRQGSCKAPWEAVVANVMAHRGEERIISGSRGSGTVFFAGCNMRCVFCQNYDISYQCNGRAINASELATIFQKLEHEGVHNINLVTPSHYTSVIAEAIIIAKKKGVKLPFVYNTNSYDSIEALKMIKEHLKQLELRMDEQL